MGIRRALAIGIMIVGVNGGALISPAYGAQHPFGSPALAKTRPERSAHGLMWTSSDVTVRVRPSHETAIILKHDHPSRLPSQTLEASETPWGVLLVPFNPLDGHRLWTPSLGLVDVPGLPFSPPLLLALKPDVRKFGHIRVSWTTPRLFATLLALLR
jgi:hypothetical protein